MFKGMGYMQMKPSEMLANLASGWGLVYLGFIAGGKGNALC